MLVWTLVSGLLSAVWSVSIITVCVWNVARRVKLICIIWVWRRVYYSRVLPVYASPFPNESTSQGTFRPETWTEQEALHHLPHSLARCSETSDSSSTASTTKTKTRNRKYNNMVLEAKSAILLVYLMTSIELTHFIITQRPLIKYNPVILL